jgi:S1-C subfamily serine protease
MDRVSSGISPGDSGGGIFNTAGELVAMMLGSGPACHHAYVVPMADLQEWLQPLL